MILTIAFILATIGISILARLEEKLNEAFSDPNWMNNDNEG
jgi:hypothetical protein